MTQDRSATQMRKGVHQTLGTAFRVEERCVSLGNIRCLSLARAAGHVYQEKRTPLLDRLLGIHHFDRQVSRWLALRRVPEITLVWLGHNDLDWVAHRDASQTKSLASVKTSLTQHFEVHYLAQLRRMLETGANTGHRKIIIACALIDFERFFKARGEAERLKQADPLLYPYLERDYDFFASMRPEFRDGMIELSVAYNDTIKSCVDNLANRGGSVELVYSSSLHDVDIGNVDSLSEHDAWHPSREGHRLLAAGAFTAVEPYLRISDD
jgi:hypothetical protein